MHPSQAPAPHPHMSVITAWHCLAAHGQGWQRQLWPLHSAGSTARHACSRARFAVGTLFTAFMHVCTLPSVCQTAAMYGYWSGPRFHPRPKGQGGRPTRIGGACWGSRVALRRPAAEALWALGWGLGLVVLLALRLPMSRWPASTADPALRSARSAKADLPPSGPLPGITNSDKKGRKGCNPLPAQAGRRNCRTMATMWGMVAVKLQLRLRDPLPSHSGLVAL